MSNTFFQGGEAPLVTGLLDCEIWYYNIHIYYKILFLLVSGLVKFNFTTVGPSGKILMVNPWKYLQFPALEKLSSDDRGSNRVILAIYLYH